MLEDLFSEILEQFNTIKPSEAGLQSPLVLAYLGDTVYEVFIRTLVVHKSKCSVHQLHKASTSYVKAKAQSNTIHNIMDKLTEEELDIVRRGRNAKSGTIPKNADVTEYKYATGFEALLGYLYLKKEFTRLVEVMMMSAELGGKQETKVKE